MTVQFLNPLNLRDETLVQAIKDVKTSAGDTFTQAPSQLMKEMGLEDAGGRPEPGVQRHDVIHAARLHCVRLESNGAVSGRFTHVVAATTTFDVLSLTRLGIRSGIDAAHHQAIVEAFTKYNVTVDGPLPAYIASIAAASNASPLDCGLFLEHRCTFVARSFDNAAVDAWFTAYFNRTEKNQRYWIQSVEWLFDFPPTGGGPNTIAAPLADAEKAVGEVFEEMLKRTECEGISIVIPPKKIESLRLPDQVKVEWEWAYIRNGCGGGFHFWRPITYYRDAKAVLYATGAYPGELSGVSKKIEQCIYEAAAAAVFYALVTGDTATGIVVFKEVLAQRLKDAFGELHRCLSAEIYVVEETGPWHK